MSEPNLHVDRLVVVLGPPTSGKSTFVRDLQAGRDPEGARVLGIDDPAAWPLVTAVMLDGLRGQRLERAVFHYALSLPVRAALEGEDVDLADARWPRHAQVLDICRSARELAFVVVWADPRELHRRTRFRQRRIWFRWDRIRNPPKLVERLVKLRRRERLLRRHGERLLRFYETLVDFCEAFPGASTWVLDPLETPRRLHPPADWRKSRASEASSERP